MAATASAPAPVVEAPTPTLWAPIRLRSFRLLWLGQSLSLLGDGFSTIAFSWITLAVTHSTLDLGYVLTLQAIPRALLTLVGGSLSDKWSPRTLMTASSLTRALVMGAVGAAGLSGGLGLWMLLGAAAVFGAVDAFFQPARVTVLPSVVDKELLTQANALLGTGTRISAVLGPALGGLVVAVTQPSVAFVVDAACFALCGLLVSRIRPLAGRTPAGGGGAKGDSLGTRIREGIRFTLADSRIRTIIMLDTAVNFSYAGPFTVGFATLARAAGHGGSTTLGLLNGALAGGAMLGTLVGGLVKGHPRVGLMVAALAGWLAIGMGALGLVGNPVAAVAVVLAMGFGIGFQGVFGLSWIQRNIPGEVLSRVVSVDMVLGYAAAPISLVACGALARTGAAALFALPAVILTLTALATLASSQVRKMR
ncbi:MFS transporter [Streptacidiphilus jiangxiensis]|uniref:Predicted arabinose efflux permease, MFS family n=1 Tax=Streptacidiphilus jiangxiensis TaxID=235985 RepID=A0A1H7RDV0_STRJI|nr:MFS transporter [Streptacidiphilus jiangxiensis]SEL58195.1 Predicted arabinose efflux permease, MFS family [Streptacidiphilus jiangxiensis]